ncbi:MAG: M42 family metallopeptidase [Candidatus Riflebacteria bacterium]|nr:M42 family metallopeptidase [Candidatus Riflebacteria bacterium]
MKKTKEPRIISILHDLLDIYSPTGYTHEVLKYIEKLLYNNGINCYYTNKGALIACNHKKPTIAAAAHIDTLGLMVRDFNKDGTLCFTKLGGPMLQAFEGNSVKIFSEKHTYSGSLILNNPAVHVNNKAEQEIRSEENMHIRVDAEVYKPEETKALGIKPGDFMAFESGFEYTETGFVKSHFLDDKAGTAAIIDALLTLGSEKLKKIPAMFFFSNYEEVGHGACAGIPDSVKELLVVDMGVVGKNVTGRETCVSICAKDSSGPYDYFLRKRLTQLAIDNKIPYQIDIFPHYGSDGSAALKAGYDIRVGLIGPGVSASHGNERTHLKGITAARDLLLAYLTSSK